MVLLIFWVLTNFKNNSIHPKLDKSSKKGLFCKTQLLRLRPDDSEMVK